MTHVNMGKCDNCFRRRVLAFWKTLNWTPVGKWVDGDFQHGR